MNILDIYHIRDTIFLVRWLFEKKARIEIGTKFEVQSRDERKARSSKTLTRRQQQNEVRKN